MHLLLVVATAPEAQQLLAHTPFRLVHEHPFFLAEARISSRSGQEYIVHLLYTGLGMVQTGLSLGHFLAQHRPNAAVQFGVAGSLNRSIPLGSIVEITEDTFCELGAEDHDRFLLPDEIGLNTPVTYRAFPATFAWPPSLSAPAAVGITVNTVHGKADSVAAIQQRFPNAIETMEGAAFFQACARYGIPCRAFRGISNYVEPRNRAAWKLREAAEAVQQLVIGAFL